MACAANELVALPVESVDVVRVDRVPQGKVDPGVVPIRQEGLTTGFTMEAVDQQVDLVPHEEVGPGVVPIRQEGLTTGLTMIPRGGLTLICYASNQYIKRAHMPVGVQWALCKPKIQED